VGIAHRVNRDDVKFVVVRLCDIEKKKSALVTIKNSDSKNESA
jgi:hypothetical protein